MCSSVIAVLCTLQRQLQPLFYLGRVHPTHFLLPVCGNLPPCLVHMCHQLSTHLLCALFLGAPQYGAHQRSVLLQQLVHRRCTLCVLLLLRHRKPTPDALSKLAAGRVLQPPVRGVPPRLVRGSECHAHIEFLPWRDAQHTARRGAHLNPLTQHAAQHRIAPDLHQPAPLRPRHSTRVADAPNLCECGCLLYTSDAADEEDSGDLGGRRYI
eukprot:TRINITY_DN19013_c0_g1_i1.p1 TRINITY_DN19013_c0_g1~~TRINITY_DN19013_c0_g1_i1.p1  ORF type:complete len:211 (+),score=27.00 TRINITY_DN19013_c0_g1_i1:108-740(+)